MQSKDDTSEVVDVWEVPEGLADEERVDRVVLILALLTGYCWLAGFLVLK